VTSGKFYRLVNFLNNPVLNLLKLAGGDTLAYKLLGQEFDGVSCFPGSFFLFRAINPGITPGMAQKTICLALD
jgi:hypothetical protein